MVPVKKRISWGKPLLIAIIMFLLSLFIDFVMGNQLNYVQAVIFAVIFGLVFFGFEYWMDYRIGRRKK